MLAPEIQPTLQPVAAVAWFATTTRRACLRGQAAPRAPRRSRCPSSRGIPSRSSSRPPGRSATSMLRSSGTAARRRTSRSLSSTRPRRRCPRTDEELTLVAAGVVDGCVVLLGAQDAVEGAARRVAREAAREAAQAVAARDAAEREERAELVAREAVRAAREAARKSRENRENCVAATRQACYGCTCTWPAALVDDYTAHVHLLHRRMRQQRRRLRCARREPRLRARRCGLLRVRSSVGPTVGRQSRRQAVRVPLPGWLRRRQLRRSGRRPGIRRVLHHNQLLQRRALRNLQPRRRALRFRRLLPGWIV